MEGASIDGIRGLMVGDAVTIDGVAPCGCIARRRCVIRSVDFGKHEDGLETFSIELSMDRPKETKDA